MFYEVEIRKKPDHVEAECKAFGKKVNGPDEATVIRLIKEEVETEGVLLKREGKALPEPDEMSGALVIEPDFDKKVKEKATQTVRRNITLPEWMDVEIRERQIDASKLFREAYMERYGSNDGPAITSIRDLENKVAPEILKDYATLKINEALKLI